jgi:hypothetical protein
MVKYLIIVFALLSSNLVLSNPVGNQDQAKETIAKAFDEAHKVIEIAQKGK